MRMTERQLLAFEDRDFPQAGKRRYTYAFKKAGSRFVTSLWVKRIPGIVGYMWVATVGREDSGGGIRPLSEILKEEKELMVAIGCDLLKEVGGTEYAIKPSGGIVMSFMKPFGPDELRLAREPKPHEVIQ